ncbi:MAG: acyl transferase [Cyclobacteriaceae bacterium]|nr:acyl transferase [Cyclobacteriaceae bacterium]
MESLKSFKDKIHLINRDTFKTAAFDLFRFQAVHNELYARYLKSLGLDPSQITGIEQIPFLPISFFKRRVVKTGNWKEEDVFLSSGTSGMEVSRHYVEDIDFYDHITTRIFRSFYGDPSDYVILALLPSYLERGHSSLVRMTDRLIRQTGSEDSGFFLRNEGELINKLKNLLSVPGRKILLFGVTYALLDLAEKYDVNLGDGAIIMETGGMKGRREELIRRDVHERLCRSFHVPVIHSEYGMTELMSQAYSKGEGIYRTPPWMKIYTREINDPFCIDNSLSYGVINVIDLANIHSCAFIATDDLGSVKGENTFEILGRMDNSDTRGCNLLLN